MSNIKHPYLIDLSLEETIENHRKMWNWIADETLKRQRKISKREYFYIFDIPIPYVRCYICNYVSLHESNGCKYGLCILNWGNDNNSCVMGHNALYMRWDDLDIFEYQLAAEYARQIANLPVIEENVKLLDELEEYYEQNKEF